MVMTNFNDFLKEQLHDLEIKAEYDAREPEFSSILFYFLADGIHKAERVQAFQRLVLPSSDLRHDLLADLAHKFW